MQVVGDDQQNVVAQRTGVDQATISRWKKSDQPGRADNVAALARAYGRPVLEAFVAAGFLTAEEAKARPAAAPDYKKLSKRELLDLLSARMVDVTDELAERTTARYLADNGDDAAAALSAATRDMLDGILVATLYVAVKARLGQDPTDRVTERTGGNVTEMRKAPRASEGGSKWETLVDRYLQQAQGQPAEAISLLAHDGAKGANVDEEDWLTALTALNRQLEGDPVAPSTEEPATGRAARKNPKRPPKGPGEQRGD